jgi:hypothetical protein
MHKQRVITLLRKKSHLCIPLWELCGFSPNFYIHVSVSDLYFPRIGPHIFLQQNRQTDPGNTVYTVNLSQIYECRNSETEHYNSVLEITVSFLGIHKWIRTRPSFAVHMYSSSTV